MMSTLFFVILVAVAWTVIKLKLKRDRSLVARSSKYGLIRVKYRLFSYDVTEAMLLYQTNLEINSGIELFSYLQTFFCCKKFA